MLVYSYFIDEQGQQQKKSLQVLKYIDVYMPSIYLLQVIFVLSIRPFPVSCI